MPEESRSNGIEIILSLIILVGSFMYVYNFFIGRAQLDVFLAVILFAGSLVWLFSNLWKKK